MTEVSSRRMISPAQLTEHREKLSRIREARNAAKCYLLAEESHARSGDEMRRSARSAMDCGIALRWIRTEKTWQDGYDSWAAFVRAEVKLTPSYVYRLMRAAKILAELDHSVIGSVGTPLSFRDLESLSATLETEEDDETDGFEDAETKAPREREAGPAWLAGKQPEKLLSWLTERSQQDARAMDAKIHLEAFIRAMRLLVS